MKLSRLTPLAIAAALMVAACGDDEASIREGVVWAPSIWWGKLAKDGANANQTTSQRETDMGHGPVFYDNQVEVALAD